MKKGKELNLKLNDKFKTYYGTIDNKELKSLYISISTWIRPTEDCEKYSNAISQLRSLIKLAITENLNHELFNPNRSIVDVDVKNTRIEFNKSSYLNVEITLFVKNEQSILSDKIKRDMIRFINKILCNIQKSKHFEFAITKKKIAI